MVLLFCLSRGGECFKYVEMHLRLSILGQSIVWAYDSLKKATLAADLQNPAAMTSTNLRKYMATVTQVLDLKESQMQWVVNHLGHTMDVHKLHYR